MWLFRSLILGKIPNATCKNHIIGILQGLLRVRLWALSMVDSIGKIPVGVLTGNLVHYGNIQECLDAEADAEFGSFTGKYCVVEVPMPLPPNIKPDPEANFAYKWGVCIPSTCSATDLRDFLQHTLYLPALTNDVLCQTKNEENPLKTQEWVAIGIIIVLLMLVLLSTLYDYCRPSEKKNQLLLSFSFPTNMKNLLNTKSSPETIDVLHGFRYLGIIFAVLGNIYTAKGAWGGDINRHQFTNWMSDWSHVFVTSRGVTVDSFFVFSGMLISYGFMKERATGKKFNLAIYYIHRYTRIAPSAGIVLLTVSTLSNRFGTGPVWKDYSRDMEDYCSATWWRYMLFINNWWGDERCMEHTWYLATDMQLYIFAPILLLPLHHWPLFGIGLTVSVTIAAFLLSFGLSYGLDEKVDLMRNAGDMIERQLYEATYNRITPWLIGFLLGYFLHKFMQLRDVQAAEQASEERSINWYKVSLATLAWIVVIAAGTGILLAVHPFIQPDYEYSSLESATYLAFSHVVWALCTVFALVACVAGYGGFINIIFSWKFFVPLSRLSYGIYLTHLIVVKVRILDIKTTTYLSDFNIVMTAIAILMFTTFMVSPLLYLVVEAPFSAIERILLHTDSKRQAELDCEPGTSHTPPTPPVRSASIYNNAAFELTEINLNKAQ